MKKKKYNASYIISTIVLISLIFLYVFQVSALTQESYLLENYQEKIDSYAKETRSLEYKFLQNNSFFQIENIAQELNFIDAEKVSYIQVRGSEVVVK